MKKTPNKIILLIIRLMKQDKLIKELEDEKKIVEKKYNNANIFFKIFYSRKLTNVTINWANAIDMKIKIIKEIERLEKEYDKDG